MLCLSWLPFVLSHFKFDERVISLNRENSLCLASNVFIQKALSLFANSQDHINAEKKEAYLWRLIRQGYQEFMKTYSLFDSNNLIYLQQKTIEIEIISDVFFMKSKSDYNLRCWWDITAGFYRFNNLLLQKKEHKHKHITGLHSCSTKHEKLKFRSCCTRNGP